MDPTFAFSVDPIDLLDLSSVAIADYTMTESSVGKKTSPMFNTTNQSRNTIVLNGHNNFSSLRIEDPKKGLYLFQLSLS